MPCAVPCHDVCRVVSGHERSLECGESSTPCHSPIRSAVTARGLVALDRDEAEQVKGKNSKRVGELLGLGARAELVHRDNLVVLMGVEAKTA